MSQLFPHAAKENTRETQKITYLKQNKAMCPDLRAEGCFLRCCRSLVFLLLCFGTDGPATIKSSITGKEKQSKTPVIRAMAVSHLIDHCHTDQTQTSYFISTVQPRDKNRHKNRLNIFC